MKQEKDEVLTERSKKAAKIVAKAIVRQLKLRVNEKVSEKELDDLLDLLDSFEEAFIKKLLERKPVTLLCNKSPDIFFMGLLGMEKLAPYFSFFKLSVIFDWKRGSEAITYF